MLLLPVIPVQVSLNRCDQGVQALVSAGHSLVCCPRLLLEDASHPEDIVAKLAELRAELSNLFRVLSDLLGVSGDLFGVLPRKFF